MLQTPALPVDDMIFRHKWKILAIFTDRIPMTSSHSHDATEFYQTEARFWLEERGSPVPDPVISETIVGRDNIYQLMHFETSILTAGILRNRYSESSSKHGVEAILGTSKERSGLAAAWTSFKSTIKDGWGERNMPREIWR